MSATLVFLDTETTGLDPDRHEIWEIGCIVSGHRDADSNGEWLWQLKPNLAMADPTGLRIGRFYEREQLWRGGGAAIILASPWWNEKKRSVPYPSESAQPAEVAGRLANLLDGAHMVGAVPSFDAAFLERFLRRHGQCPTWHYHLVDVEAMAAGYLHGRYGDKLEDGELEAVQLPWNSNNLSRAVGVDPDRFDRHTALGDAHWAKAIYEAVLAGELPEVAP